MTEIKNTIKLLLFLITLMSCNKKPYIQMDIINGDTIYSEPKPEIYIEKRK